jgi:hypothetical protein
MKIYVRERTKSKEGGRNPRYRVIATEGGELRFHADHLRKVDIETIGKDLGAQVVYLPEREHSEKKEKA